MKRVLAAIEHNGDVIIEHVLGIDMLQHMRAVVEWCLGSDRVPSETIARTLTGAGSTQAQHRDALRWSPTMADIDATSWYGRPCDAGVDG